MKIRKTIGWLVFAGLMVVVILAVRCAASEAFYRAGSRFYDSGKYQAAANAFRGSVILDGRFARGYIQLGYSYVALKKYPQAEQAFLKAKAIKDNSWAACGLGVTYLSEKRNDDAEKEFRRGMSLNPTDTCSFNELAIMNYDLGKYQEALAGFKQVSTITPSSGTYVYIGNSHVYMREYEPGVDAYKHAIELNPKNKRAHHQLAIAYNYMRRYEDAASEYKEVLKLDPKDSSVHYALASVYMLLHNKPAALEHYEMVRKLDPNNAAELMEELSVSEARQRGKEKLYFVPLGNYSTASLTKLANFCKQKLGIQAILTDPVPFALTTVDKKRQQLIAEEAVALIKSKNPNLVADPNAVVIGLTDQDMYIRKYDWQYAFSYWAQLRFSVVSSARMNPANLGGSPDELLTESRMRKMVLKNIGVLYYVYPTNYDPKSVLYDEINSVEDLDRMGENF